MSGSNLDANTYLKWITFKCKSTIVDLIAAQLRPLEHALERDLKQLK